MQPSATRCAALLGALALLGCASAGNVKTTPLGNAQGLAPKPKDCHIDFLRKAPERPYEKLAELDSHVTNVPREGAEQVLRPKACELGADAVIVNRDMVLNPYGHTMVSGTAIRYTAPTAPPPAPASGPAPSGTTGR